MIKKTFLAITMALASSDLPAQLDRPEFERHLHVYGNDTLPYRLLRPKTMEAGRKYPLVLFLHGRGECGKDNFMQLRYVGPLFLDSANRDNNACFVVVPQCPVKQFWANIYNGRLQPEPSKPMKGVIDMLGKLRRDLPVDKNRFYVVGLSMGGYGTWDLIARYPEMFAAAAPICGGGDATTGINIKDIPIWAFHGAQDNIVPVEQTRKMIEAIKHAGGSPRYTEYPQVMHDSWNNAFGDPEFLPWLFSQKRD